MRRAVNQQLEDAVTGVKASQFSPFISRRNDGGVVAGFIGPPHLVRKPASHRSRNRQRTLQKYNVILGWGALRLPGNPFCFVSPPVCSEGFRRVPGELLLGSDHRGGADLTAHRRIH